MPYLLSVTKLHKPNASRPVIAHPCATPRCGVEQQGSVCRVFWRSIIIWPGIMVSQSQTEAQEAKEYMKRNIGLWLVLTLLTVSAGTVVAQDYSMSPPKVLLLQREFVKPGVGGAPHMKTESAFVQAMTAAKWPTHYLGMDSMSGPLARALPRRLRLVCGVGEGQSGDAKECHAVGCTGPCPGCGWPIAHLLRCGCFRLSRGHEPASQCQRRAGALL